MAETHFGGEQDGCGDVVITDTQSEDDLVKSTMKRCSSTSPPSAPACKSPRSDVLSSAAEEQPEPDKPEDQAETSTVTPVSPTASRRKSWRRATLTRRSLPALPHPYQALSRSISTSLPQQDRFQQLLEASVKLALERTEYSLTSVPDISLDTFKKQVEHIQKECVCLAKSLHSESHQLPPSALSSSEPAMQQAMEKVQKAIDSLQTESESWEALLNKHRSKAEELESKVALGQKTGVALDSTLLAQSSQYHFIQSKPDYHLLLRQQQPMLHTMEMIMDTQCKMVRKLLSIKEQSQSLVKETSNQLAAESGFQDLSSDLLRNLMAAPLSAAST